MSSQYAPLPFSYLTSDGAANPRVGLRKEGVYGTSADVPRIQQDPETRIAGDGENPYRIYSNANENSVYQPRQAVESTYNTSQPHPHAQFRAPPTLDPTYEAHPMKETPMMRAQTPDQPFVRYPPQVSALGHQDKDLPSEYGQRDMRPKVNNGYPDVDRPRAPSQFPPRAQTREAVEYHEAPRSNQTPAAFDNFILAKDPNRAATPDPTPVVHNHNKTNLEGMFNHREPTRNHTPPPPDMRRNGPSNARAEPGFDGPNYDLYYGGKAQKPTGPPSDRSVPRQETSEVVQSHTRRRESNDRRSKDDGEGACCCGTCTAVIIAIIITAIICLGAGFVAGWFGGIAARENSSNSTPYPGLSALNQSTEASDVQLTTKAVLFSSTTKSQTSTGHSTTSKGANVSSPNNTSGG